MRRIGALRITSVLLIVLITSSFAGWKAQKVVRQRLAEHEALLADQVAMQERVALITSLDVQRSGRLRVSVVDLLGNSASVPVRLGYMLREPYSRVEDADIRGFADGSTQYDFNQGTSYHMRLGRRYHGREFGRFELKRSLIRWTLPKLPGDAVVATARAKLWVEAFLEDSPLYDGRVSVPLHLYAYPMESVWQEGRGGVERDDFSTAAPGEVWWNEARNGELAWPDPGALEIRRDCCTQSYMKTPLSHASIAGGNREVTLSGRRFVEHAQERLNTTGLFDLLLKLDDLEEDRVGTELAIISSNFGDHQDLVSMRPTLELEVDLHRPASVREHEYTLEAGAEDVLPVQHHEGRTVIIAAELLTEEAGFAPQIWVRGGSSKESAATPWERLTNPIERRWDWSQIRISAALNRVEWGDDFSIEILETWIKPGPREEQVPQLTLLAPSGQLYHSSGKSISKSAYRAVYRPMEFGLWRYVWSFETMPEQQPNSHIGFGMFYVSPSTESVHNLAMLREYQIHVMADLQDSRTSGTPAEQAQASTRFSQYMRLSNRFSQRDNRQVNTRGSTPRPSNSHTADSDSSDSQASPETHSNPK